MDVQPTANGAASVSLSAKRKSPDTRDPEESTNPMQDFLAKHPLIRTITLQQLRDKMHLTMKHAATEFKTSDSNLKKICRMNNIHQWPARQVQSKLKALSILEQQLKLNDDKTKIQKEIQKVHYEIALLKSNLSPNVSGNAKRAVCRIRPEIDNDGNIVIPHDVSEYYLGETTVNQQITMVKEGDDENEAVTTVWYEPNSVKLAPLVRNERLSERHYEANILDVDITAKNDIIFVPSLPTILLPLKENRIGLIWKPPLLQRSIQALSHVSDGLLIAEKKHKISQNDINIDADKRFKSKDVEGKFDKSDNTAITHRTQGRYGFKHYIGNNLNNDPDEDIATITSFDYENYFCLDNIDNPEYHPTVIQTFLQRLDSFMSPRACGNASEAELVTTPPRRRRGIIKDDKLASITSNGDNGIEGTRKISKCHNNNGHLPLVAISAIIPSTSDDENDTVGDAPLL